MLKKRQFKIIILFIFLKREWTKRVKVGKEKKKSPSLLAALWALLGKKYLVSSLGIVVGEIVCR